MSDDGAGHAVVAGLSHRGSLHGPMSDAAGPSDPVLCVNAAPNHVTGEAVPLGRRRPIASAGFTEFCVPVAGRDARWRRDDFAAWCRNAVWG